MPDAATAAGEITQLLGRLSHCGRDSERKAVLDELVPRIYGELKSLARANRYRWDGGVASPGTTSLVHEAYGKLAARAGGDFENRRQFFAVASRTMRSILIDNARWCQRKKRGGGARELPLDEQRLVSADRCEELLALDEALERLEDREPRWARIVECRFFGGLTVDETAEALEVSPKTVKRGWSLARAWLYRDLQATSPGGI